MKNMPRGAKRSLIFSQVDSDQRLPELLRIADSLTNTYHSITACSPQKQVTWFNIEPITGIIWPPALLTVLDNLSYYLIGKGSL